MQSKKFVKVQSQYSSETELKRRSKHDSVDFETMMSGLTGDSPNVVRDHQCTVDPVWIKAVELARQVNPRNTVVTPDLMDAARSELKRNNVKEQ